MTIGFESEPDRNAEFYLFGGLLWEFLRHSTSLNTRLKFSIDYLTTRETFSWPAQRGMNIVL